MKPSDFLTELSNEKLAQYKTAAAADASKADKEGDYKKGDKRFSGIVKATKKQFANDEKKVEEGVNLSPDQIQQMFQGAENIETGAGANRSLLGKTKDWMASKNQPVTQPVTIRQHSDNPKSVSTPNVADQAMMTRQQKQAQAAQAARSGMTTKPTSPTAALNKIAPKRIPSKPGEISGLKMRESVELTESQIFRLIGKIVEQQKQVDEGVMDWARTKGQNLTNKITADKLLQAWKKAGSKTDSDEVAKVMTGAGVPQETVDNLMKNFVKGASGTTNTNVWQGVDRNIPAVQRKAQAAAGGATTSPAASTASGATEMPAGWRPSDTTSSGAATTPTSGTTNTATAGRVGAPAGKQAVDQAVATVKSVRGDRRPQVANYGKQQFDALAQTLAKQPAVTTATAAEPTAAPTTVKPNNTVAMPKRGEKIKWGGQEFKPGDPMYDRMKAAAGTNESAGLPSPSTYEETNDMFKSSGQRRIGTLTTEDEQIDGMAQGEIRAIIKNAIHIKNQLDKGVSLDGWMYSYVTTSNDHLNSVAEQINNPNIDEQELDEACWKGYHKEGNKKMFGKTYPNCVKNEGVVEAQLNELDMWAPVTTFIKMTDGSYVQAEWRRSQGNPGITDSASFIKFKPVNSTVVKQLGLDSHQKNTSISNPRTGTIATGGDYQGSGPLANRRYDVVDYNKPETMAELPPEIKSELVKWVQTQGVAEGHHNESCPHCGGELVSEELMNEKKDACYYKVKSRYKVWPSAYASGALVKCRKKGASNWGTGGKSNEGVAEGGFDDASPMTKDSVKQDHIRGLKNLIAIAKEKGRQLRVQELELELKKLQGVAEGSENLSYIGNCTDDDVIEHIFGDATNFAQAVEEHGDEFTINDLVVKYDPKTDVHSFYYKQQGVAEGQLDEKWTKKYKDSINCSNPKGFSQKAHCAGKQKNESSILEGIEQVDENLHKWFKEKWVRFGPDGKIRGACARGSDSEGKPKCLPQSKAHSLGKKGRASAAARKRREDPNPERSGKAINVNTKKK